ncbi:hypothetical protein GP486_004580 [Trichoglossum hirsutum]|uniref:Postreplication repair E3 ubiquitin-protein ligase RAD18 n=1 Tax=Trichoglossum hirsutum TaxID=265104 RepID=A0A9P8LAT9_9PEZI|nr:hypothetical protein GP486_004580 [Trichoglossum hirsutum]
MDASEVSDSTDWLHTPLPALATVESALREDQEVKLRKNWALQELVDAFRAARPGVMELARHDSTEAGGRLTKRKLDDMAAKAEEPERPSRARKAGVSTQSSAASSVVASIDGEHDPSGDGLVPCPICNKRMREESVYLHLDRCERESKGVKLMAPSRPTTRSSAPAKVTLQARSPLRADNRTHEHLPRLNYSILKEYALRKKLSDLGLNSGGPRSQLEKRHTEWVHLWNANCDSLRPKSKRELLQDLEAWERSQAGSGSRVGSLGLSNSGNDVMRKDFDGASWAKNHHAEFQQLIAKARKKKAASSQCDSQNSPTDCRSTASADSTHRDFHVLAEEDDVGERNSAQKAAPEGGASLIEASGGDAARADAP